MGNGNPWYRDAVVYQLHVRAFLDSNADGIGDFLGLADRLDYLQDLGVTALWLLPFYPSPLRDDGYDIADYTSVHPDYGSIAHFKHFLNQAHERGLKVVTELVLNHTSDRHPWFQAARLSPAGSPKRDFYVWSDTPEKYKEARIIFKDFETSNWTWDPVAGAYYWHRFYSHQPDLNFENPSVRRAMFRVLDFWMRLGVDGVRLDAVPYLFEKDGTSCENLPETHEFLKQLRRYIDERYDDRMLLAEANQWPEDAIAYFGNGDECHMAFHFPVMPRMFMGLSMEDRTPIIDIMDQTPTIPAGCQWAVFLRNHDELTLEMVTDEERDYMYRAYAHERQMRINLGIRRRLAPLLNNNRRRIELMNALLFSMPGTPIIYYGDEIGMGDNIFLGDRNGVRTPLQWNPDRNAGFSKANPQRIYSPVVVDPEYHYETINIEIQRNNPQSLLWWTKRLIALRKRYQSLSRGSLEFLHPENRHVLAYVRRYESEIILAVVNLSRFVQFVELNLSQFNGMTPVELFGRTPFPKIGELPYLITLGPHSFYWFSLERSAQNGAAGSGQEEAPRIVLSDRWGQPLTRQIRSALESALPSYLPKCRWFGAKSQSIRRVALSEAVPIPTGDDSETYLTLIDVEYIKGARETYFLPLSFADGERAERLRHQLSCPLIARAFSDQDGQPVEGAIFDATLDDRFAHALIDIIQRRRQVRGGGGEFVGSTTKAMHDLLRRSEPLPPPSVSSAEQSNTSIVYGNRLIVKVFRKLDEGVNPDLEIGRVLTERARGTLSPRVAGALEFVRPKGEPITVAIAQEFVANEGNAWDYTIDHVRSFFEYVLTGAEPAEALAIPAATFGQAPQVDIIDSARRSIGPYLESADTLGCRTAELHLALSERGSDPAFAPEPFLPLDQRSLYQSLRALTLAVLPLIRQSLPKLSLPAAADAGKVAESESTLLARFRNVLKQKASGMRIRLHGDYHLGQVLYTGKDFIIIDFEGEPARPISERRLKRPPLRDLAGMLRSFDYAIQTGLTETLRDRESPLEQELCRQAARFWSSWVSIAFLKGYLRRMDNSVILPKASDEFTAMLDAYLLEKALSEIRYELNHRPNWVHIPLRGLLGLLATREGGS